jgi:hypothetical protein
LRALVVCAIIPLVKTIGSVIMIIARDRVMLILVKNEKNVLKASVGGSENEKDFAERSWRERVRITIDSSSAAMHAPVERQLVLSAAWPL